jgi:hypothetical protein
MQRLHAGDHAKLSESRNIRGAGILNVLDLVPGIRAAIALYVVSVADVNMSHICDVC